jgi:serine/threonine protein kinase
MNLSTIYSTALLLHNLRKGASFLVGLVSDWCYSMSGTVKHVMPRFLTKHCALGCLSPVLYNFPIAFSFPSPSLSVFFLFPLRKSCFGPPVLESRPLLSLPTVLAATLLLKDSYQTHMIALTTLIVVHLMEDSIRYPCGLDGRDVVGAGITGIVARLDAVIKFVGSSKRFKHEMIEREKRVYQRLGSEYKGVLRYYGDLENALILQYAANGSIRQYFAGQASPAPLHLQIRWIHQITASITFIHSKNVMHGDISCNNVFLDEELNTKLGDFGRSPIDDEPPLVCYETSHELPNHEGVSDKSEIFALGSTFYEVMTGSKPYKGLLDQAICDKYSQGNFPSLTSLPAFKDIIAQCWGQNYTSVHELLRDVQTEGIHFIYFICQQLMISSCCQVQARPSRLVNLDPLQRQISSGHQLYFRSRCRTVDKNS